ncbi:unnamed protein product [Camellia sinensis]
MIYPLHRYCSSCKVRLTSYVFGKGTIGEYIASNGGVVTAEELAPYLDLETKKETADDSYILPVLLWFDGQPEVDEEVVCNWLPDDLKEEYLHSVKVVEKAV